MYSWTHDSLVIIAIFDCSRVIAYYINDMHSYVILHRSVRFALEIPGVKEIVANDFDSTAVEYIRRNIQHNKVIVSADKQQF